MTITGAQLTGSQVVEGETYAEYTLGDATVLIDEDITKIHGVV